MSNKDSQNQNGRRHFSPEDKVKIRRFHLLKKKPASDVCEKHQITPTQFYQWQKLFFEKVTRRLPNPSVPRPRAKLSKKSPNWKPSSNAREPSAEIVVYCASVRYFSR